MTGYLDVGTFVVAGALFYVAGMWISHFLGPRHGPAANSSYECGVAPIGDAFSPFRLNFYRYALIFLVFDVQVAFLFPWVVIAREAGRAAFAEILVFAGILVLGLAYGWKKKVFIWT